MGTILAIHIADEKGAPLRAVGAVHAVAGKGLEGDRYFRKRGTYSATPGSGREVTLIEAEALEGLAREYGIELPAAEARRNLLTQGVALNHLVGRTFSVGGATLRGTRLCEPCGHMEKLCGRKGSAKGLIHRGGLRAEIVVSGTVRVGDEVNLAAPMEHAP
ncbi:MAG: MOSC domain-containing protein [Planctomycetota bacterium]|nr:MOSC domain-containing protein [Planctomycetota bacterium]